MPHTRARIDIRLPHGDDLALEPHFHPPEELRLKPVAAGQGADMGKQPVEPCARASDGAVDPLRRKQERAGDALGGAKIAQRPRERGRVVEPGEMVERANCDHAVRATAARPADQGPVRRLIPAICGEKAHCRLIPRPETPKPEPHGGPP